MQLLSLLSVIEDRKYVIFLRKVENKGTIFKHDNEILMSMSQLDWGTLASHFSHWEGN